MIFESCLADLIHTEFLILLLFRAFSIIMLVKYLNGLGSEVMSAVSVVIADVLKDFWKNLWNLE